MKSRIPNNRTEEILNSLDGLQKADAPDFFYTRLLGRMQNRLADNKRTAFILRPAFLTAALSIVLLFNIVSLNQLHSKTKTTGVEKAAGIDSFADAYNLNSTTAY